MLEVMSGSAVRIGGQGSGLRVGTSWEGRAMRRDRLGLVLLA